MTTTHKSKKEDDDAVTTTVQCTLIFAVVVVVVGDNKGSTHVESRISACPRIVAYVAMTMMMTFDTQQRIKKRRRTTQTEVTTTK